MENGKLIILLVSILWLAFAVINSAAWSAGYVHSDPFSSQPEWTRNFFVEYSYIFIIACHIFLFVYTPMNAKKSGHSMPMWGALTFFFGGVASLIYVLAIKAVKRK
jgi:hypothetical protein